MIGRGVDRLFHRQKSGRARNAPRCSISNKALLQVSLMVLYALVARRVDDCIRVPTLHEQAAQSATVPDIDLGRGKRRKKKKNVHKAATEITRRLGYCKFQNMDLRVDKIEIEYRDCPSAPVGLPMREDETGGWSARQIGRSD